MTIKEFSEKALDGFYRAVTSKIVWWNVLSSIAQIVPVIEGILPAKWLVVTGAIQTIVTIILRTFFNKTETPKPTFPETGATYTANKDFKKDL